MPSPIRTYGLLAFSPPSRDFRLRPNGNRVEAESQGVVRSSCPHRDLTSINVDTAGRRDTKEVGLRMPMMASAPIGGSTSFKDKKQSSTYAESCTAKRHNHES